MNSRRNFLATGLAATFASTSNVLADSTPTPRLPASYDLRIIDGDKAIDAVVHAGDILPIEIDDQHFGLQMIPLSVERAELVLYRLSFDLMEVSARSFVAHSTTHEFEGLFRLEAAPAAF